MLTGLPLEEQPRTSSYAEQICTKRAAACLAIVSVQRSVIWLLSTRLSKTHRLEERNLKDDSTLKSKLALVVLL